MRIIKGTDAIPVEHPIFLLVGDPGIGKTSLSYSTESPLLLDFDAGAHRAANRRDTLVIERWADVAALAEHQQEIADYQTIVVDTVGRCLDLLTADIIAGNPKLGPGGNLSQQGWGVLRTRFRTWLTTIRGYGKGVLLVAHAKEEREGDTRLIRADIAGGSYGEVMKVADFVGYLTMSGKDRILDFNPTDRYVGKNPGQWPPMVVPPVAKATTFLAGLVAKGRDELGRIGQAQADALRLVDDFRASCEAATTVEDINRLVTESQGIKAKAAQAQAKTLVMDRAKALGFVFDAKAKAFTAPEPVEATA